MGPGLGGMGGKVDRAEEGKERKLNLACKMRKHSFFFKKLKFKNVARLLTE